MFFILGFCIFAHGFYSRPNLFDEFNRLHPGRYQEGQLRSLQRQVKAWKEEHVEAKPKAAFFEQVHTAGRMLQLDWFYPKSFTVTI